MVRNLHVCLLLTYYEYLSGRRAGPGTDFKCSLPSVGAPPINIGLSLFPLTLSDPLVLASSRMHVSRHEKQVPVCPMRNTENNG